MAGFAFHNRTHLDDHRLRSLCGEATAGWSIGNVTVRFRYSRGADFSGSCHYRTGRIYVNLGRHVVYPYRMATHVGRTRTVGRFWIKPRFHLELGDGYQLAMFIFTHELYHLLVKRARRNTRQKESMCDRFATRFILSRFGGDVRTDKGDTVQREDWDFQDLDRFVDAARDRRIRGKAARQVSVAARKPSIITRQPPLLVGQQLWLFP